MIEQQKKELMMVFQVEVDFSINNLAAKIMIGILTFKFQHQDHLLTKLS